MSSSFPPNPNNFLPETFILPEDDADFKIKLYEYLNQISLATNSKDSGLYVTEESITGKQFIPTFSTTKSSHATYRDVFRVVVDTGALPNAGTSTTAHGINTTENYSIIAFYGGATAPGASTLTKGIPLPHINTTTPGDSVTLTVDATNINITTTTANYTGFTRSFVVIEYIKET